NKTHPATSVTAFCDKTSVVVTWRPAYHGHGVKIVYTLFYSKYVRHPTTNWTVVDIPDSVQTVYNVYLFNLQPSTVYSFKVRSLSLKGNDLELESNVISRTTGGNLRAFYTFSLL
ncbi:hypothetical protein HELRODRAFT_184762, partial [Helobdella robusta]|uniref:Fibronectin type-III domain-containing protein n=1 Tax=Helobdella robusta TaxID=6412 RepID=T1FLY0_HELRO